MDFPPRDLTRLKYQYTSRSSGAGSVNDYVHGTMDENVSAKIDAVWLTCFDGSAVCGASIGVRENLCRCIEPAESCALAKDLPNEVRRYRDDGKKGAHSD